MRTYTHILGYRLTITNVRTNLKLAPWVIDKIHSQFVDSINNILNSCITYSSSMKQIDNKYIKKKIGSIMNFLNLKKRNQY